MLRDRVYYSSTPMCPRWVSQWQHKSQSGVGYAKKRTSVSSVHRVKSNSKPEGATFEQQIDLKERFDRLASQWEAETKHLSSITEMSMNLAYQQIIGMGPAVVPI